MSVKERLEEFVKMYREKENKKNGKETYPLFTDQSPYLKNPFEMYKIFYNKSIDYYKKKKFFSEYSFSY